MFRLESHWAVSGIAIGFILYRLRMEGIFQAFFRGRVMAGRLDISSRPCALECGHSVKFSGSFVFFIAKKI
jgi:hypothetical protein